MGTINSNIVLANSNRPEKAAVCQSNLTAFCGKRPYSFKLMTAILQWRQVVVTALYRETAFLVPRYWGGAGVSGIQQTAQPR